jgi:hypothetical protein
MKSSIRVLAASVIAAAMMLGASAPAQATVATSIKIISGADGGDWLGIGELQVFAGGVNVALATNGAAVFGTGSWDASTPPSNATDGIISTSYPNIYHSDGAGPTEYLQVNFTGAFDVSDIVIYGRGDGFSERNLFSYKLYEFGQFGDMLVGEGGLDARNTANSASVHLQTNSPAPVPEPGTWAMMILGFGVTGAAVRRRRIVSAA